MQKISRSTIIIVLVVLAIIAISFVLKGRDQEPSNIEQNVNLVFDGTVSNLKFESRSEEEQIKKFDKIIEEHANGWKSAGYEEVGNFYEKSWCTGTNAPNDCMASSSTAYDKDQHVIDLGTLHYTDDPEFFGLEFSALKNPEAGWGTNFYFSENGKSVVGEGFSVNFYYFEKDDREPQKILSIGSSSDYKVYEKNIFYGSSNSLRKDVDIVLSSAESMRDYGLNQFNKLSKQVYDYINSEDAVRCEYEPYQGMGIPPRCIEERSLTDDERKESLESAQKYFTEQIRILNNDYTEMYVALLQTFPFALFDSVKVVKRSIPQTDEIEDPRSAVEACSSILQEVQESNPDSDCSLIASKRINSNDNVDECIEGGSVAGCFVCTVQCDI